MKILCFGFFAASMVYGQAGSLAKPAIGFVFDNASHALRRVHGLPGAALVGASVDFGFVPATAHVAPKGDAAFVAGEGGAPHFFRLTGEGAVENAIEKLASFRQVVFSPSGTAAALLAPGSVQILIGLPEHPAIAATLSPRAATGRPRTLPGVLAVSDDGAYLIQSTGGAVELFAVAGDSRQIADPASGMLAAFAPGSHDAALTTADNIIIFNDLSRSATSRRLAPVAGSSSAAFAPDGRSLLVASATGRSVTAIQVDSGDRTSVTCDCAPTSLARTGNLFRLNDLGKGPLWMFDPTNRNLFFVPAPDARP